MPFRRAAYRRPSSITKIPFYEILAEELARRDMDYQPVSQENYEELVQRMDDYIAEFEAHGTDNILISDMDN